MSFKFKIDDKQWRSFVKQIQKQTTPKEQDKIVAKSALEGRKMLVFSTPKKTGITRSAWNTTRKFLGEWEIFNPSKVMVFLDQGTKAHGPVKAKRLFIPKRPNLQGYRRGMKWGKDFVLAKWVKGIKAMNIVSKNIPKIQNRLFKNVFNILLRGI